MTRCRSTVAAMGLAAVALLASACSSSGVQVVQSSRHGVGTGTSSGPGSDGLPPVGPVAWTGCPHYPSPWQCASITVPLDYADVAGTQISIALIRLPANDPAHRIGPLLLNPGGPGGSGIGLAFNEGESYPQAVLDRFDIVGFDPRGVGASNPVLCPASFDPHSGSYDDCIPDNRDVLPFLGTPNVARDMDEIRVAIGVDQISYLGYSYGTALGAVFADMFPGRVRAMVLDGAVDPDAGLSNTSKGGIDFYADQDFEGTIAEFEDLCDATPSCPAGPHTSDLVKRVGKKIKKLTTASFPGSDHLTHSDFDDLIANAMYSARSWSTLAFALKDADQGDASTLAAFYSWLIYGFPADITSADDEEFANVAIRCADFANREKGSADCESFPDSADPLPVITAVDTSAPILVVGTKSDPATPARYAPLMAAALGDAVSIEWEGAGHTATLTSKCITSLVGDYLVSATAPDDGTTCPFVTGKTTKAEWAAAVFAAPDIAAATAQITDVLAALGDSQEVATCVATRLARLGDQRLDINVLLGIESANVVRVRKTLEETCAGAG